jgi:hypothetical protein
MPKSASLRIPSYRRHKASGQAGITLDGRDIYLGKQDSAASRQEYNRLIAEWRAAGGRVPSANPSSDLTIAELPAAFLKYAKGYHSVGEQDNFQFAMKPLKALYSRTRVADFGPLSLKAVRQTMIDSKLARATINKRVNRIRHIFKWGVENELATPSVLHGLKAVAGLRSEAREAEPVRPVRDAFVDVERLFCGPAANAIKVTQKESACSAAGRCKFHNNASSAMISTPGDNSA